MITLVLIYLVIGCALSAIFYGKVVAIYRRVFERSIFEAMDAVNKKEVVYSIFLWPATVRYISLWQEYFQREVEECKRLI